tara:strand:+ start:33576 stop:33800 length:225 start_codon:yes stop_codon:yes gene_type:complete
MRLTTSDLKPENIGMDPFKLHLNDFNITSAETRYWNNIEFVDDNSHSHWLKSRGCIKKRKYRRVKRRVLKFKNS